ncbi:tail fiber/spike domain-containing protein [Enterobacter ludwigii]|uniref:tail fiber/spike domain-containing protein n=1 Tax=Enterobacter ludwigii TaxID=299767 RepID=UPI0040694B5D
MATQPTNLPVPSESPRDLKFNAGKIDEFVTSLVNTYVDRFGNEHYTIEGLRWLAQQAIAQYGWIPVGTFQAGATLTLPNQILKDTTDGEYYRWDGSLPKTVPVDSTPDSTGGVGSGAWINVGDSTLRALLASANGSSQIGTSHRGLLSSDLNAIDRRPSGYGDSVSAVMANGQDIDIASDVSVSSTVILADNQSINGRGGKLSASGSVTYGMSANADTQSANGVNLNNYVSSGVINSGGSPGYALLLKRVDNAKINGMTVDAFSGAVEAIETTNAFLSNILASNTVYHPTLAAGGYGALLENAENTFVDGVNLSVGSGNNGRHVMYVSRLDRTDGGYDGCQNLIATRIFGKYVNKDDRNFPGVVFRKSNRTLLHDFIIDGANGGIGYNVQNGNILNNVIGNGALNILKYQDGTTVRAISQGTDSSYYCSGFVYHDMYIEVMPKVQDGTLNYQDCVAFDLAGRNGLVTNCVTKVARSGRPIYIESGTTNVVIDGIVDVIEDNGTTALTPFISFNGACSNISVKNIKTSRPMLSGLSNVTDMTVDWTRRATVTITSGSAVISNDTYGILSTVSPGASAITIALASHVTQDAALTARIIARTANQFVIATTSSKTLGINAYTIAGVSVTPSTSSMTFDVVLSP